jgi:hypothetical protein
VAVAPHLNHAKAQQVVDSMDALMAGEKQFQSSLLKIVALLEKSLDVNHFQVELTSLLSSTTSLVDLSRRISDELMKKSNLMLEGLAHVLLSQARSILSTQNLDG